ncbi:MAG: hypothetical protein LBR16_01245 [Treponema sp.]|jgi:hypothetical protein|nr:hypothetical protein [Treponema sp.]
MRKLWLVLPVIATALIVSCEFGIGQSLYKDPPVEDFIPVEGVSGMPSGTTVGTELDLAASVIVWPDNATDKNVHWRILDEGDTTPTLEGSIFKPTHKGIARLAAYFVNKKDPSDVYMKSFLVEVKDGDFVSVHFVPKELPAAITGVPQNIDLEVPDPENSGEAEYTLFLKSHPNDIPPDVGELIVCNIAPELGKDGPTTNRMIEWTLREPGLTGATLDTKSDEPTHPGNILRVTSPGVLTIRATIINGLSQDNTKLADPYNLKSERHYMQDFAITVHPASTTSTPPNEEENLEGDDD